MTHPAPNPTIPSNSHPAVKEPTMEAAQEPLVYVNGELVPASRATVSVFDRGFRWGDGVYEMARTFNGKIWKLREHLDRLYWSLQYTRIDPRMDIDALEAATFDLVETNFRRSGPEDVGVTHIISRGVVEPTRKADMPPTVVIYTEPLAFGNVRQVVQGRDQDDYPGHAPSHAAPEPISQGQDIQQNESHGRGTSRRRP